jgi:hypothetical protein
MIIEIAPDTRSNVPTGADFLARIESSFAAGELIGVIPLLKFRKWDGTSGEIIGTVNDTDFLFPITPEIFTPGEWTINPEATVSAKVHRWPRPAILVFEDPLTAGADCAC